MTLEQARLNTLNAIDLSEVFELIDSASKKGWVGVLYTVDVDNLHDLESAIVGLKLLGYSIKRNDNFTIHIHWEIL